MGGLLAGIALQSDIAQVTSTTKQDQFSDIATLSRSAMNKMGDVLWSVDARRDTIGDLVTRMRDHATMLLPHEVEFKLEIQGLRYDKSIKTSYRKNIYLIYKEAMNNIVKHSSPSKVAVEIINERKFIMTIQNDGLKTDPSHKPKGQGLQNMYERAQEIDGQLLIQKRALFQVQLVRPRL
ncbi:MAG: hypothetical protein AAFR14_05150 [Bacteroidota bacterium]